MQMSFLDRFTSKMRVPDAAEALPGREHEIPGIPERHEVLGTSIREPFPEGIRTAVFGLGCFWGAERLFWQTPGVYTHGRRLRRRQHAEPDLRGGLQRRAPATPRPCSSPTTRPKVTLDELLQVFWEGHDPTQGMRQGNDVGTQYRSAIYLDEDELPSSPRRRATRYQAALSAAGHGEITTEIAAGRAVLLRRGLPPAVPAQGPERLLRARRDRRQLPGRRGRQRRRGGVTAGRDCIRRRPAPRSAIARDEPDDRGAGQSAAPHAFRLRPALLQRHVGLAVGVEPVRCAHAGTAARRAAVVGLAHAVAQRPLTPVVGMQRLLDVVGAEHGRHRADLLDPLGCRPRPALCHVASPRSSSRPTVFSHSRRPLKASGAP